MPKTIIRTTACLAVSAAAFIAITRMDASAARSKAPAPEGEAAKSVPPRSTAAPEPRPPAPELTPTRLNVPTTKAGLDGTLTVPDWQGKRLSVAFREARKLGLSINAVDDEGESIPADLRQSYRVRRMLTKAGTAVAPGADVEVRAREIVDTAIGY
jgi:hypothetical protein